MYDNHNDIANVDRHWLYSYPKVEEGGLGWLWGTIHNRETRKARKSIGFCLKCRSLGIVFSKPLVVGAGLFSTQRVRIPVITASQIW